MCHSYYSPCFSNLNSFSHECLERSIQFCARHYDLSCGKKLLGIDATCGNGYDTVFLSKVFKSLDLNDNSWEVYGFDLQAEACLSTQKKFYNDSYEDNIKIINKSHEELESFILEDHILAGIIFNLGYLPGSDKRVVTSSISTLTALNIAFKYIADGGSIVVHAYGGHEGGDEELMDVSLWFSNLDYNFWRVLSYKIYNKFKNKEVVYIAQKLCFKSK